MYNRLRNQSSPYLLQHASNPVDWYPWGDEAFARARREDKPVFVSIGYSTCHWCHVMARESFEDRETADILNKYFISVKVDREERPDIDSVYMEVCQAFTGSGGWPLSVFLTAEQEPFFAGTYFPPVSRYGMTGFRELLLGIAEAWRQRREALLTAAKRQLAALRVSEPAAAAGIDRELPRLAAEQLSRSFDREYGGFGREPKFPMPHNLLFLTLYSLLHGDNAAFSQVKQTLEAMRRGGIFDQLGGGFSRYSTDRYFLIPHFEKMLYDNALLIVAYCAAHRLSGEAWLLDTAERTAEYVFREMTGRDGEFFSAQDADSEGEEGRFYVWSREEICGLLGKERGEAFCAYFGMTGEGNFEGRHLPNLRNGNPFTGEWEAEQKTLLAYRGTRAKLHLDDKVLTSWNGLMICAMTVLYRTTGVEQYLDAAKRAERFLRERLSDGAHLYVSRRGETRSVKGFLDDYANTALACLCLYGATGERFYLERAELCCAEAKRQFADEKHGGYFLCGEENDRLVKRPKETYDGAIPSGNSVMALCLVRLSQLTDNDAYRQEAERQLAFLSSQAADYPSAHCVFLIAELLYFDPPQKITAVLSGTDRKEDVLPTLPLLADVEFLEAPAGAYRLLNDRTTYYVCRGRRCLPPTNEKPFEK